MRLTTLPQAALFLTLSLGAACVAPVGGGTSDRDKDKTPAGSCAGVDDDKLEVFDGESLTIDSDSDLETADIPSKCWTVRGKLTIEGTNVTSLAKLGKLASVTHLEIDGIKLSKLGLVEPLTVYETLEVHDNSALTTLEGIEIEQDVAISIKIDNNDALTSLGALKDVTKVEHKVNSAGTIEIPGDLVIRGNAKLAALGFEDLTEVQGKLEIHDNAELANLDALADLTRIGGDFTVTSNPKLTSIKLGAITKLEGATRISTNALLTTIDVADATTVKRFEISDNAALTSFTGFRATQITGDLMIRNNRALTALGSMFELGSITGNVLIADNAALANLGNFTTTLRNITGSLTVTNNPNLTDLGQLSRMNGIALGITITNNTKLSTCKAQEVDHCVPQHGAVATTGNAAGSNCNCWCGI